MKIERKQSNKAVSLVKQSIHNILIDYYYYSFFDIFFKLVEF